MSASENEVQDPVMQMVREQLARDNPPNTAALYGRASRIDASIRELTPRQFFAKYPLQVKRQQARRSEAEETDREGHEEGGESFHTGSAEAVTESEQEEVREILLEFARDLEAAESPRDLVLFLMGKLEEYVEKVLRACPNRLRGGRGQAS